MAGRPRKPTKLKLLEGNRGKRKLQLHPAAQKTPVPPEGQPPAWLPEDAALLWPEVVAEVGPLLSRPHMQALAILCTLLAEYRRRVREGKVSHVLASELRQYFGRFGMTEADLGKLSGPAKEPEKASDLPPELRNAGS